MSYFEKRKFSMFCISVYYLFSAVIVGFVLAAHSGISCRGVQLAFLVAPFAYFGALAFASARDRKRGVQFVDPAEFGMSIGVANLIRTVGMLVPIPFFIYAFTFASGMSCCSLTGTPESIARTNSVIALDEKLFGHSMAQNESRLVARRYARKHNFKLAEQYVYQAISCAEEHQPDKPTRVADLHQFLGKIAARGNDYCLAERELSIALAMRKDMKGTSACSISRLEKLIEQVQLKHKDKHPQDVGARKF
ncbi:MAG: hypothetical protein IAF58_12720 [Leptolyngbya sp.]|nr:hypothetical protein [Candidatus Melainabacteria bacterium]